MFEKLEQCPSCGSSSFQNKMIAEDHTVSHESFAIVQCNKCNLLFTNPRPPLDSISKYYDSPEYISHSNQTKSILDIIYQVVRNYSLKKKYKLIQSLNTNKSLLDYGCGTGHFLNKVHKEQWKICGVEPNSNAQHNIESNIKKYIHTSLSDISPKKKFGVITLWHVLEHVHELNETLNELKKRLDKNGKLIIAVPNPNSFDATYFKKHWAAYDVPRHLYHFTQGSMKSLIRQHGLRIVKTLPMKFDSFYVSLLSNKYKYGKSKHLNSFITGYKSNTYANKSGEYSSLIYIVSL